MKKKNLIKDYETTMTTISPYKIVIKQTNQLTCT